MKGVIFVELIKMAEEAFGEETVDQVLDNANLESGGSFTTVGNYPCSELVKLIVNFSSYSGLDPETLQRKFGHWMLNFFVEHYPEFFADKTSTFAFLHTIDREIHVEVLKLYPEAELPRFYTTQLNDRHLEMIYSSPRPLEAFCHGLIEASLKHFEEEANISRMPSANQPNTYQFDISLSS